MRKHNDLTSQYNAGGYIRQQDGVGDAAHGVFEMSNEDGTPRSLSSGTASWLDRVELEVLGSTEIVTEG